MTNIPVNEIPIVVWLDDDPTWEKYGQIILKYAGIHCCYKFFNDDDAAAAFIIKNSGSIAVVLQDLLRPADPRSEIGSSLIERIGYHRKSSRPLFPVGYDGGSFFFYVLDQFIPEATKIFHSSRISNLDAEMCKDWSSLDPRVIFIEKPSIREDICNAISAGIDRWKAVDSTMPLSAEMRILAPVSDELISICASNSDYFEKITPDQFEKLVGAIMRNNGFIVEQTTKTRDGGYDLKAISGSSLPNEVVLVEAKRYHPGRAVPVEVVRALYGARALNSANKAMLVTTSHVSRYAHREFAKTIPLEMELIERNKLVSWCEVYLQGVLSPFIQL